VGAFVRTSSLRSFDSKEQRKCLKP
jgi:hypothetical protein